MQSIQKELNVGHGILNYYFAGWKKFFVYRGCATRKEFWSFIIVNSLIIILIAASSYLWLVEVSSDKTSRGGMILAWAYTVIYLLIGFTPIILLFPTLSLGIRRMHDIGKSGWWFGGTVIFILFIRPIITSAIYYLLMNSMNFYFGFAFSITLSITLNIIFIALPLWLCCKPTRRQDQMVPSTTDASN